MAVATRAAAPERGSIDAMSTSPARRTFRAALCVALVLARSTLADPGALDPKLVPAPPARGSAAERADFDRLLEIQRGASPADRKRALAITDEKLGTLFGPPYGPLTPAEVERWSPAFAGIANDVEDAVGALKSHFKRPRPYNADPRVQSLARRDHGFAYPSGSAAVAQTFAQLLAGIDPARRERFLARAAQIGNDRIVVGAHHPADIQAGVVVGDLLEKRYAGRVIRAPGARPGASAAPPRGP